MTTKEKLHSEIDKVEDEYLDQLYEVIKNFVAARGNGKKPSFMSKLRNIRIDAPEDFAANLDLYTRGEKHVEPGIR